MSIFDEDFSTDTIGTFPTGWGSLGLGGSVIAGPDYFSGKAFQPAPSGGARKGPNEGIAGTFNSVTTYFAYKYDQNVGPGGLVFQLLNATLSAATVIFSLYVENDRTISATAPGIFLGNSNFAISDNDWNFFQVNVTLGTANVSGTVFLTVATDIIINGIDRLSIITQTTNAVVSSLPTGGADCEQWQFQANIQNTIFSNITANSGIDPIPNYPHPGSPFGRVSQAVIEPIELVSSSNARVSQGVIEIQELPSTANVRISQMVIELLLANAVAGGWQIYEA